MEEKSLTVATPEQFTLPAYEEIPDVGLFLEQVVRYAAKFTAPAALAPLTGSMVSNYVNKKIISNPVKKMYSQEQIACLLFIAAAKNVVPMDDLQFLFAHQQEACSVKEAYEYFRSQLTESLRQVFSGADGSRVFNEPELWKSVIHSISVAAAHGMYLDRCLSQLRAQAAVEEA